MNYQNIIEFEKTPRNISKKEVKSFLQNGGSLEKGLMISFLISIGLSIISIIIYFLSIVPILVPIILIITSILLYFSFSLVEPKIEDLNNYPLSIGYVLVANNGLYNENSETQGGSMIIFTKENELRLNNEWITNIGTKIRNREIQNLDFLYQKIDGFSIGKSFFSIDIPANLTNGIKIYCSYVILDTENLPGGKIPEDRLIPCLVDKKDRGIAIPSKLIE